MTKENGYRKCNVFLSFLIGGILGAGLAILFASRSGRETRQMIKDYADETADEAKRRFGDAKEKIISSAEKGREFVEKRKSAASAAFESGKEAYKKDNTKKT